MGESRWRREYVRKGNEEAKEDEEKSAGRPIVCRRVRATAAIRRNASSKARARAKEKRGQGQGEGKDEDI